MHGPRLRDVFDDERAGTHYDAIGNTHAQRDKGLGAHPHVLSEHDRFGVKLKVSAVVVMRPAAQVRALGNHAVTPDRNQRHVVNIGVIGNADMVTQLEIPRCPHFGARINMHTFAQARAEQPQQKRPPTMKGTRAGTE